VGAAALRRELLPRSALHQQVTRCSMRFDRLPSVQDASCGGRSVDFWSPCLCNSGEGMFGWLDHIVYLNS
jgi:hypothetical protein